LGEEEAEQQTDRYRQHEGGQHFPGSHAQAPQNLRPASQPDQRVEDRARRGRETRVKPSQPDQRFPEREKTEDAGGNEELFVLPHTTRTAASPPFRTSPQDSVARAKPALGPHDRERYDQSRASPPILRPLRLRRRDRHVREDLGG